VCVGYYLRLQNRPTVCVCACVCTVCRLLYSSDCFSVAAITYLMLALLMRSCWRPTTFVMAAVQSHNTTAVLAVPMKPRSRSFCTVRRVFSELWPLGVVSVAQHLSSCFLVRYTIVRMEQISRQLFQESFGHKIMVKKTKSLHKNCILETVILSKLGLNYHVNNFCENFKLPWQTRQPTSTFFCFLPDIWWPPVNS